MLTLITGTPGAGKSLYTVWEIARHVPGSTLEVEGAAQPRRLFSNIKHLALDHEVIGADHLNTWHTWAKPGDVIVYDEVQEVWRPRAAGSKVPECIAALETHRHLGVDIVLITQHPLLVDPNIRRLVNQHLHLRRITRRMAMVYEWDHAANIASIKGAIQSRLWRHPVKAYTMYKSAQAHTKPTQRLPRVVWFGVAALAGAAILVPNAIGRLQSTFSGGAKPPAAAASAPVASMSSALPILAASAPLPAVSHANASEPVQGDRLALGGAASKPKASGCILVQPKGCQCFDAGGVRVDDDAAICEALGRGAAIRLDGIADSAPGPIDPGELELLAWMAKRR